MSIDSVRPAITSGGTGSLSSDLQQTYLSSSCFDFLLIELVPMAYRLAVDVSTSSAVAAGLNPEEVLDEEERREAAFYKLDLLGYRVGQGLVERFSRDRPRFTDGLDAIKFLCKDLWTLVFRKQIDNLKTNHRGVYVLTDNSFRPFSRMSMESGGLALQRAQPFLWFPCGLIRGALSSMNINATVQAETSELPGATFQIKTVVNAKS
ncbi:BET3 family protein [Xylona heveae TC161]|uniref:BET3 family protein n=1 Tax=Xylona heveae (strain CBS 132557 / TC161) TaxID=1328760 RepID=A0A165FQX2_XYLHT|nr:BET3 family protein [Xylona heveae TC161]KZF21268.1 BET3 family protein [Xylona heveae TC161]